MKPPRGLVQRVEDIAQRVEGEATHPGPPVPQGRALVDYLLRLSDDLRPLPPQAGDDGAADRAWLRDCVELRRAALDYLAVLDAGAPPAP
jgi:hypothetical protein